MSNLLMPMKRRTFLQGLGAAGLTASLPGIALSQDKPERIVLANYGGDTARCIDEVFGGSFQSATGVSLVQDGSGPSFGKTKAMIESGNIIWDLIDGDVYNMIRLMPMDALLPIDYSIVDRSKVRPEHAWEYGFGSYLYSYVMAWDSSLFDEQPTSWADFFDLEKFPGKRGTYKWGGGTMEATALASGSSIDHVYPVDMMNAEAMLRELGDNLIIWSSGSESQQLFYRGEVAMSLMWSGRAVSAMNNTDGRVKFTFNQGILSPGSFNIMNNGPNGAEWANRFIAFWQDPERQAEFYRCAGYGPTNPAANSLLTEEENVLNPGSPENFAVQCQLNPEWVANNLGASIDMLAQVTSG